MADVARIMAIWKDCLARYGEALESMPAWQEWYQAALAETAFMPVNEV
jgi:glutathione S-transferase